MHDISTLCEIFIEIRKFPILMQTLLAVAPYICLMSGWIQEEYVVINHLLK